MWQGARLACPQSCNCIRDNSDFGDVINHNTSLNLSSCIAMELRNLGIGGNFT